MKGNVLSIPLCKHLRFSMLGLQSNFLKSCVKTLITCIAQIGVFPFICKLSHISLKLVLKRNTLLIKCCPEKQYKL